MRLRLVVFTILFLALLLTLDTPEDVDVVLAETSPKNHPPVAVASIYEDPVDLWTNMSIKFTSAGSYDIDGEGRISFIWDFDDGSDPSYLAYPTHVYKEPGTYTVTLTVIDQKNVIALDTFILVVQQDYGDTDIVIKALEPTSSRGFKDPPYDQITPVAVKHDGWVAYLCHLKKGNSIRVTIHVIGDRPVDAYLFRHDDFMTYKNGPIVDSVPSEIRGTKLGFTSEFSYYFTPTTSDRYIIVIDNRDLPPGTDTEGPVDYMIFIDPMWDIGEAPGDQGDIQYDTPGLIVGMLIVIAAIVVVITLLKRGKQS